MPELTHNNNLSSAPIPSYDVVVVGAGPVGLATAIGLRKRGIENILVVDQTHAFRQVGQVIDLLPNGLKALKYLDSTAYEDIKEVSRRFLNSMQINNQNNEEKTQQKQPPARTLPAWVHKNLLGEKIRSISLDYDEWFREYGEGRLSITWYDLQNTLRHLLPQEQVRANHRCINVLDELETGYVRVGCVSDLGLETNPYAHWGDGQTDDDTQSQKSETLFQPSATQSKSFRARLVVAADGINSLVRRVLYADRPYSILARPEYSGFAAIICTEIGEIPNELETELEEKFLENLRVVSVSNERKSEQSAALEEPRLILFRSSRGQIGYIIHLPLSLDCLQEKSGHSLIALAVQELEKANFPPVLKQLVLLSPPGNIRQRPYYIHRAAIADSLQFPSTANLMVGDYPVELQPAWSRGRVVLVGDAAHGMPPFMAQGANQGLEDALIVATLIAKIKKNNQWHDLTAIAKAFEKYERLRRPLMVHIQQATLTRFPHSSDKDWQEYTQLVYRRNFNELID